MLAHSLWDAFRMAMLIWADGALIHSVFSSLRCSQCGEIPLRELLPSVRNKKILINVLAIICALVLTFWLVLWCVD